MSESVSPRRGDAAPTYFVCPACGVSFKVAKETSARIFCSAQCRRFTDPA